MVTKQSYFKQKILTAISLSDILYIKIVFYGDNMKAKKVGVISERVIELLELDICAGTPIYLGESNIEHMKTSHLRDYIKYGEYISVIIDNADYVGINSSDNSIEFVKEFVLEDEYVKVAVRVSKGDVLYARSLYVLNKNRVKNFIAKHTLKKT